MSTVILQKNDASFRVIHWLKNLSLSVATQPFVVVKMENVRVESVVYRVPNAESLAALEEVANNEVVSFKSWDDFFVDLYDDDEC